jgi:hypothetical protein
MKSAKRAKIEKGYRARPNTVRDTDALEHKRRVKEAQGIIEGDAKKAGEGFIQHQKEQGMVNRSHEKP